MGRHYLEHLLVFLSADFFLDVARSPSVVASWTRSPRTASEGAGSGQRSALQAHRWRAHEAAKARLIRKRPRWWATQEAADGHGAANAGRDVATETGARGVFAARRNAQGRVGARPIKACRSRPTTSNRCSPRETSTRFATKRFSNRTAAHAALPAVAPFDAAGIRGRRVAAADQPWIVAARAAPRAGAGGSPAGAVDANRLAADGDQDQRAGRSGANGARKISARLHALRRTRCGSRTRPETAERIPRQPGAPEIAQVPPDSNS